MAELAVPVGRPVLLPGRGTTWVRESGSGDVPVVLLHGFTATAALNWGTAFGPLSRRHRVIALDHRGHGRGIHTNRFRLEDCADDVVALADVLGVDRFIAAGYSMGGPIAQLTWRRHPERVAGLVFCATARRFRPATRRPVGRAVVGGAAGMASALRMVPGPVRRRVAESNANLRRRAGLPDWALDEIAGNDPAALLDGVGALTRFDSSAWIGEVDVPAASVITDLDRLVPPQRQARLAASIPGCRVWHVEGDHTACWTAAGAFVPALLDACDWVSAQVATTVR